MNTYTHSRTSITIAIMVITFFANTSLFSQSQCTLSGNYTNTNNFLSALNAAKTANCTNVMLTGSAQFSGDLVVPSGLTLVIGGSATINGSGSFTSTSPVIIETGGNFVTNGRPVTIAGYTYSGLATVPGYAMLNGTVLKVEWANLSLKNNGATNDIHWTTQNEENMSHFVIERSINGGNFQAIGEQKAEGGLQRTTTYFFKDATPSVSAVNYYRIQSVDKDGKIAFSRILSAQNAGKKTMMKIYPTVHVGNELTIELANINQNARLNVLNTVGQVVASFTPQADQLNQTLVVPIADLGGGVYFVSLTTGKTMLTQKFVKF
jgi:hypothetical protein